MLAKMRTAILVRDVPYGTLQLVFFEFFKELSFFSSNSFRNGRLELKACDFGRSVLVYTIDGVNGRKGGLRLPVNFFHMQVQSLFANLKTQGTFWSTKISILLTPDFDFEMC